MYISKIHLFIKKKERKKGRKAGGREKQRERKREILGNNQSTNL